MPGWRPVGVLTRSTRGKWYGRNVPPYHSHESTLPSTLHTNSATMAVQLTDEQVVSPHVLSS